MTKLQLTAIELIAEGMKRANESGMDLPINRAKIVQLHLFENGYRIVRETPAQSTAP